MMVQYSLYFKPIHDLTIYQYIPLGIVSHRREYADFIFSDWNIDEENVAI